METESRIAVLEYQVLEKVDYCVQSVFRVFRAGILGHIDEDIEIQLRWENSLNNRDLG